MPRYATEQFAQGPKLPLNKYVQIIADNGAGVGLTKNREYCIGLLMAPQTLDRIVVRSNAGDAGAVLRIGVRVDANGSPGAPQFDTTVPVDGTGIVSGGIPATINYAHPGGVLWLCYVAQNWTTTSPVFEGCGFPPESFIPVVALASAFTAFTFNDNHRPWAGWQDGVTGALPASFTNTAATNGPGFPQFFFRRSA